MNIVKVYIASEEEKKSDNYLYSMKKGKLGLYIQCLFLLFIAAIFFIVASFNLIMTVPIALAIYNCYYIYTQITKAEDLLKKKSPKYLSKYYSDRFFYLLDVLFTLMKDKEYNEEDIHKWEMEYIKAFKSDLSSKNFKLLNQKLLEHIKSILGKEFVAEDKALKQFQKKKLSVYEEKYFPELENLFQQGKIDISANGAARKTTVTVTTDDALSKNLKLFGLPASTKNFKIITKRYYELVRLYHPDRSSVPNAQNKLAEVNKAYLEIKEYFKKNNLDTTI